MIKSYFYIKRSIAELSDTVSTRKVYEIFSQEKDTVFFHIPSEESPFAHLIVSVNPQLSFIQYKNEFHKAKKNVVSFIPDILPRNAEKIMIAEKDRIVLLMLENLEIYILFHGSKSNIIFFERNSNSIVPFKKLHEPQAVLQEIQKNIFIEPVGHYANFTDLSIPENNEAEIMKKEFPNVSKEIWREAEIRKNKSPEKKFSDILDEIVNEIETGKIITGLERGENKIRFLPATFERANNLTDTKISNKYNNALQNYLSLHYKFFKNLVLKKEVERYVNRELTRLANKLNNLKARIDKGSRETEYNKFGGILLANRNSIGKGISEIELPDYETGEIVKIKLDPKLSPQENIDRYFEKSRDEKINFQKSKELFETTEKKYAYLQKILREIQTTEDVGELERIKEELNISKTEKMNKSENKFKFRKFLIENKYNVFVGKDSKSNDYLSIKFAKQNDYWFHARGLAGSHVVLRVDNPKEGIPKNILKKAASIAAYFSKGKTAGVTPVSYTLAKYVYKKKGMEPGKVMISKEKVLLVKPEIPEDCEQIND